MLCLFPGGVVVPATHRSMVESYELYNFVLRLIGKWLRRMSRMTSSVTHW